MEFRRPCSPAALTAAILAVAGLTMLVPDIWTNSVAYAADTRSVAPEAVDYERDIQPIFDEHCVLCHMTGAENGGLNLEGGQSQAHLVKVKSSEAAMDRVAPGQPGRSYLLNKLDGTQAVAGGMGERMPLGGPGLNSHDRLLIERWISSLIVR